MLDSHSRRLCSAASKQRALTSITSPQGYFAPWSRQNTWNNRIAINNIRKDNTPQVNAHPKGRDRSSMAGFSLMAL